jgi:hypothetical protein
MDYQPGGAAGRGILIECSITVKTLYGDY